MQNHNIILLRQVAGLGLYKPLNFALSAGLFVTLPLTEPGGITPVPSADFGTITSPLSPSVDSDFGTITTPTGNLDGGTILQ